MKALLKHPLDHLKPGIYDIEESTQEDPYERGSAQIEIYVKARKGFSKTYWSIKSVMEDWFFFQDVPEVLKDNIKDEIAFRLVEGTGRGYQFGRADMHDLLSIVHDVEDKALSGVIRVVEGK